MTQAKLIRIDEFNAAEMCMTKGLYRKLVRLQETEVPVTVTGVGCEVDGEWEHDYHDITLPDGAKIEALSGIHLERLTS